MKGKKKKVQAAKAKGADTGPASKAARRAANAASKEERRARKLALRKKEKKGYTADMWAEPAPSHLVAKLDIPRVKSKYQSYFEFAANPEKKDKKLEFKARLLIRSQPISTNVIVGHQQCGSASRLCFCTHRGPDIDQRVQGAFERKGCHDLHRFGMATQIIPSHLN
jgi:hypothetical protein